MSKLVEVKKLTGLPCTTEYFRIKGKDAHLTDFGYYVDGDISKCEDDDIRRWGCFEKQFKCYPHKEILAIQYRLTPKEYDLVCSILEHEFNIGTCNWCV